MNVGKRVLGLAEEESSSGRWRTWLAVDCPIVWVSNPAERPPANEVCRPFLTHLLVNCRVHCSDGSSVIRFRLVQAKRPSGAGTKGGK